MTGPRPAGNAASASIHQVGARYGVRDYLRIVDTAYENAGPMGGEVALSGLARRMRPHAIADATEAEYASSILGPSILSTSREESKRLGKPMLDHWIEFASTGMIRALDGTGRAEAAVGTMRTMNRIQNDRIMIEFLRVNAYLTVHALERLYERESIPMGGMPAALSSTITRMHHGIAVACREGIDLIRDESEDQGPSGQRCPSTMLVPFGDGLLVVEKVPAVVHGSPITRYEARNGRMMERASPETSFPATRLPDAVGEQFAQITFIGRTYLSRAILRPDQIAYLDLFENVLRQDDSKHRIRHFFHTRERHARFSTGLRVDHPGVDGLKELLPYCVTMGPGVDTMYAITRRVPGESFGRPISYDALADHCDVGGESNR